MIALSAQPEAGSGAKMLDSTSAVWVGTACTSDRFI